MAKKQRVSPEMPRKGMMRDAPGVDKSTEKKVNVARKVKRKK